VNTTARESQIQGGGDAPRTIRKPEWLKVRLPSEAEYFRVSGIVKEGRLHTICQSARCPNVGECWSRRTATFLILGDTCTRACGFCAVKKGAPAAPDPGEPGRVAAAVKALGLGYTVVTSVTRDDLADGGASIFVRTIAAVREASPQTKIEVLIPDFAGDPGALDAVLAARPDILNHNLETTEALYPRIHRPEANYRRSLAVLASARKKGAVTKSGLMVGLGEREEDVLRTLSDLRGAGCELLTLGQYLRPGPANPPVARYYSPKEFEQWRAIAMDFGFTDVVAGPLVRSSYGAEKLYLAAAGKA
jgi:lipoyl synthase